MTHAQAPRAAKLAVAVLAILYAAYFSLYTCTAHDQLKTFSFDLGTFDQGIWLAGHGTDLFVTVRGLPLLGDHVRLISFVLAPLYWIWDDVRALLVLQSVVIAAGAWLIARIGWRELPGRPWLVVALAASYLVHPAVQNLNLDHAHPDAFAQTFLLAAIDALGTGRLVAFCVAAALAMSCKEDVPLVFVAMGLAMTADPRRQKFGIRLAAVAGVWFVISIAVILPYFNGVGFFRFGTRGLFRSVHNEGADFVLPRLLGSETLAYLSKIGLPNLYLFVLAPLAIVPAFPALAANIVTDASYPRSMNYHYQTSIVPFFYLGTMQAIAAIDRFCARVRERPAGAWQARAAAMLATFSRALPVILLAAAIAANQFWSLIPLDRMGAIAEMRASLSDNPRTVKLHAALAQIPREAVVSADYAFVPHLSHRPAIYDFPNPFRASNWGVHGENPHDPEIVDYVILRNRPGSSDEIAVFESMSIVARFERLAGDKDFALYRHKDRSTDAASRRGTCGDWNGDGMTDEEDVRVIAEAILRKRPCPPRVCDADGDGQVRYGDVMRIRKRAADPAAALACPP